ncbi:MAG: multidrug transporter, partial [Bacteroidia bacterium 44-10]
MIKNNSMKIQIIGWMCATALLSSCHIYKSYERPEVQTAGVYRDTVSVNDTLVSDTANFGNLPWKEVFRDARLQALIEQGLAENISMQTALLRVEQAKAGLLAARLAFAPSLTLTPNASVNSFDGSKAIQTYSLPASASWEIDLFGNLMNGAKGAKAGLLESDAYRQAVQTQVIANIANSYYTLLMLDKQLEITEKTATTWGEQVRAMKALKNLGMTNEATVAQSEAYYYQVQASLPEIHRQIRETENALSLLLGQTPQRIDRATLEEQEMPDTFSAGVPLQLLSNRPDVRQAEMALASAYYATNQARSAFYPK